MTVDAPPPPRRSRALRILLGCVIALVVCVALFLGSCGAFLMYRTREVGKINDANLSGARPVIDALDRYRKANGRYPESLCAVGVTPHFAQYTQVYYTASPAGDRFWLAVTFFEPHFVLPSDDVHQFDSTSREWSVMDMNDALAKYDAQWAEGCR